MSRVVSFLWSAARKATLVVPIVLVVQSKYNLAGVTNNYMYPSLQRGDFILIDYGVPKREIEKHDVVLIQDPNVDYKALKLLRVIATEAEIVGQDKEFYRVQNGHFLLETDGSKEAIFLPMGLVRGRVKYAWRFENGKLHRRPIETEVPQTNTTVLDQTDLDSLLEAAMKVTQGKEVTPKYGNSDESEQTD
mmetsp:Transcript_34060/g.38696  ORF Transcript_34060/g.38696 Transcript_34060/m.38696 type:complete len:191 (-) Transcript_34060:115-687(-)